MPLSNLRLFLTVLQTEGPGAVLGRLAFRFMHIHTFDVYRLSLSNAVPEAQIPADIEFKEVSKDELREMRTGRDDLPEYFYRDLNDDTLERCWVGLHDGQLGFVLWVSYRGSSNLVRVGASQVELAYAYCLQELRGRRLTANAFLAAARTLHSEGITSLLAVPNSRNPAIVKSFLACGFKKIGSIRRFFGLFTWPRAPVDYSTYP